MNTFKPVDVSQNTTFDSIPDAIFVGKGGDLYLVDLDGDAVRFNCKGGQIIKVWPTGIQSAGTTAGDVVAIYFTAWGKSPE